MDFPDSGSGYFGHVVTGGLISSIPMLADLDISTLEGRLALSLSGAIGSFIAMVGDKPKNRIEAAYRVSIGIFSCFLFAPWLAKRFGLDGDLNGNLLVFGLLGVVSWYFAGSVSRGLVAMRDSGSLWRAIAAAVRMQLPKPVGEQIEPKSPKGATTDGKSSPNIRTRPATPPEAG